MAGIIVTLECLLRTGDELNNQRSLIKLFWCMPQTTSEYHNFEIKFDQVQMQFAQ